MDRWYQSVIMDLSSVERVSGYPAARCAALSEENRDTLAWLDPGSGHPDGRSTTPAEDELCREAAYLNYTLERTAGSHALAAAARRGRCPHDLAPLGHLQ